MFAQLVIDASEPRSYRHQPRVLLNMAVMTVFTSRSASLSQHRAQLSSIECRHECGHLAVERNGETDECGEAWDLQPALHVAQVGERHFGRVRNRLQRHAAFLPQLAKVRSE
jgi:hypothetical protein